MKRSIIQYTFRAGLGDIITGLYECLCLSDILRNFGYSYIELKIFFFEKNTYFYPDDFFKVFNFNTFQNRFDKLSIDCGYNSELFYNDLTYVYTPNQNKPNQNLWDLYLSHPNDFINLDLNCFPLFYDNKPIPYSIDIINNQIIEEYKNIKVKDRYTSMMYRVTDTEDREDLFDQFKKEMNRVFYENNLVFVSSNSYKFKKHIIDKNLPNVFMYTSPFEEEYGNHMPFLCQIKDGNIKLEKTKHCIIEMLTHSDSSEIHLFSCWNIVSSFLFFSNIKKVKKNIYHLKCK